MWLLVAKAPVPDATYWHGRRWLAAIDAVLWPLLWALVVRHVPTSVGVVGPFVVALAALCAMERLHRALRVNHRYRFTTWRWARVAAALILMATVLRLTHLG